MRGLWPLATAGLVALLGAACGGDEPGARVTPGVESSPTIHASPTVDASPAAEPSPAATAAPRPAAQRGRDQDVLALLRDVAKTEDQTTYKVVYEMEAGDPDFGEYRATLTLAADPPSQVVRVAGVFEGEEMMMAFIDDGEWSYWCLDVEGDKKCLKTASAGTGPAPLPRFLEADEFLSIMAQAPGTTAREVDGQQIAGRDTRCFQIDSREGEMRICIDREDWVVLLTEGRYEEATFRTRVIEISDAPTAADFEPPYPVTEG